MSHNLCAYQGEPEENVIFKNYIKTREGRKKTEFQRRKFFIIFKSGWNVKILNWICERQTWMEMS